MTNAVERPNVGASAEAIRAHYDVSNRFYELWLDPTLTYSCALWAGEDDTLEAAQRRKLAYVAEPALSRGAKRVLDVGSGWGSLLRHLTANGVDEAVGLTLSQQQYDHVTSLTLPGVEVRLESWRDHRPAAAYDAIISIGAFEHFANPGLSDDDRIAVYRSFFEACHGWLKPGAPLVLQTIAYGSIPAAAGRELFFDYFPESDAPRPFEIFKASQDFFEVTELRNDREHYSRTLRAWHRNLRARLAEAVAEVGAEKVEFYKRYLGVSAMMFGARNAVLLRLKMTRAP